MNILHLVLDMDLGGQQRVVRQLIRGIDRRRFRPYLCCLDRGGMFLGELKPDLEEAFVLGRRPGPFDLRLFLRLRRILRQRRIEVLHSHNGTTLYAALAGRLAGVRRLLHTDHGRLVPDRRGAILEDRLAARLIHRFVGVSAELTTYLERTVGIPSEKLCTVLNGVDTKRFAPASPAERAEGRRRFGLGEKERVLGTVCRLDPIKNLELLIEALPALVRALPDCRAMIVGEGPEKEALRRYASRIGVGSRLLWAGAQAEVERIMPLFDLYLSTSRSEGTSMTILEAMACGLPVVASEVGGNGRLVDDSNGRLFPAGDAPALSGALLRLLDAGDGRLARMGRLGREKAEREFAVERVVEKYTALYGEAS